MSDRDILKGKMKQVEGALQDAKGDFTNDPSDDLAGKAKKVEGKVQEGLGRLGKSAKQLGRDLDDASR